MDNSGNQTTISYLTFKSPDGSYLVTAKGGKIEGEGGSILDIPEGALVGPTVIKITTLQESNLPTPLQAPGKYLGAVNIDTGGMPFQKAVEISIPIPDGFNTNDAVFITKPGTLVNSDDTTEQVYEIIDSTKIVGNRITSACDPFPGVWAGGSLVFTDFPDLTPIVVSGYTYQDRNDLPSFQAPPDGVVETPIKDAEGNLVYKYDRPIQGAVIRSPDAWNYVSYTNSKGFYGTFASMAVLPAGFAGPDANCKRYRITAVNPQTMFKGNFDGYACAPPYNVRDVNFKLADKDTIPPDRTAPAISMSLSPISGSIVAGTTTVGTKLKLPVSIIDQAMKSATLTVNYSELGSGTGNSTSFVLKPPVTPVLHAFIKAEQANVFRYDYTAQFNPDAALNYYTPELPGYYTFTVEAHDAATPENVSIRTLQLHVVASGASLGTPVDGPPRVDAIFPENDSKDIMVTTQIVATFNEPVQNVEGNFKLIDTTTGAAEPTKVITSIEGGRMLATLIPSGNLYYARKYKVVLSTGIKDTAINPSSPNQPPAGDGLYNMENDFISYFTTKVPNAYDLTTDQQFTGGRDIDLYSFVDTANETNTYAYVAAGDKGWKIVDVTDPTQPGVIFPATSDYKFPAGINYRSVAVHPDKDKALMGMTENITFADGNQYGYVRFYDLSSEPGNPPVIGREKLAEAYSGIPGRLAMWGDYAVVSTAVAGIQIVNIKQAIENQTNGQHSDGSSIAGVLDTEGQGYGSPNDLAIFNERSAVFTTNPGYLLTVDLNLPTDPASIDDNEPFLPVVISAFRPTGTSFTRIGVATGFPYTDANGIEQTINLAVTASAQGKINTIDLTDPTNPNILNPDTVPVATSVRDITVSKDAGLAFVTTYNAIQVYDIKDPTKPRLLNEITQLPDSSGATNPDGTPVMVPIGETPAIIEKGGWVYLANMTKGMRTLDLDPVSISRYCLAENDKFCNSYYPALGAKTLKFYVIDYANSPFKTSEGVKVMLDTSKLPAGVTVTSNVTGDERRALVYDGYATFYIYTDNDKYNLSSSPMINLSFKIDTTTLSGVNRAIIKRLQVPVQLKVRTNSTVKFGEVLRDEAVYILGNDLRSEKLDQAGKSRNIADDSEKYIDYVKELLNQVVPRKRSVTSYSLLDENGISKTTSNIGGVRTVSYPAKSAIDMFKNQFNVKLRSDRFNLLMGVYNKKSTEYADWDNMIIDKNLLVGTSQRPTDNIINGVAGSANDAGLYELYKNVVVKYVKAMKEEGERYAGERGTVYPITG